jgi:hypothetical protein
LTTNRVCVIKYFSIITHYNKGGSVMTRIMMILAMVLMLGFAPMAFGEDATAPVPEPTTGEVVVDVDEDGSADVDESTDTDVSDEADVVLDEETVETGVDPLDGELATDEEAAEALSALFTALLNGEWLVVFALLIMLVVFALRKFGVLDRVRRRNIPYVPLTLGLLLGVATALLGGVALVPALLAGLTAGLAAVGLWDVTGRRLG